MAEFNYKDSSHKFTAPVRKFKANDPYYYEVDNIPLGQLEANDLWLRDQIIGVTTAGGTGGEVGRSNFSELKPYADGGSNTVKVKGGRYTARINDAYKKSGKQLGYPHLNVYEGQMGAGGYFWGGFLGDGDKNSTWWSPYQIDTGDAAWSGPNGQQYYFRELLNENFQKFQSPLATNALFMNGLGDRILSHMVSNAALGGGGSWLDYNNIGVGLSLDNILIPQQLLIDTLAGAVNYGYPLIDNGQNPSPSYTDLFLKLSERFLTDSFSDLSYVAAEFTKRWAGAVRTAIVDVPTQVGEDFALEIEVPPFKIEDFYYIQDGTNLPTTVGTGATRFDLLFIYSKPVDASSSWVIDNRDAAKVKEINKPALGIVVGAGLAVDYNKQDGINEAWAGLPTGPGVSSFDKITAASRTLQGEGGINDLGSAYMLPSFADSVNTAGGFLVDGVPMTGSFPSPDDLMNLTPNLLNDIRDDDARLLGQSILPIAYIRRTANTLTVTSEDIIDIRPFFRTTELSYNERAGIAAATPSLSFANPAVGKTELLRHFKHFSQALNLGAGGGGGPANNATLSNIPRTIGGGIIWGGKRYGPEAALTGGTGFPGGAPGWDATQDITLASVPEYPDWDIAEWCTDRFSTDTAYPVGQLRNDRIFIKYTPNMQVAQELADFNKVNLDFSDDKLAYKKTWDQGQPDYSGNDVEASNYIYTRTTGTHAYPGSTGIDGFHVNDPTAYQMYWLKKKIQFADLPTGFSDYDVRCNFLNCVPLGTPGSGKGAWHDQLQGTSRETGQPAGFWIEKGNNYFIIYLAFIGPSTWYAGDTRSSPQNLGWRMISDNFMGRQSGHTRTFAVVNSAANKVDMGQNMGDIPEVTEGGAGSSSKSTVFGQMWVESVATNKELPLASTGGVGKIPGGWQSVGVCTYPTVQFEITGYPNAWGGFTKYGLGSATDFTSANHLGNASINLL